ncbi:MAG: T9SS type A sorting domain-containing protein [Saprospiraceae bacterium]|nr:T9SS type A sorting domain-containing protein [Saprospiraceae bacterium]
MKPALYLLIGLFIPSFLFSQECPSNNTFSDACPVVLTNLMGTVTGSLNPNDDVDFYSFNITRAGVINVRVTDVPSTITMNIRLFHESDLSNILDEDGGGFGETVEFDELVCPVGKYYIRVAENPVVSQSSPDLYNLKITFDTTDVYECNNNFATATSIELNEDIQATLRSEDDVDFYCFTIPRAGIINARATNVPAEISMNMRIFHESNQSGWVAEGGGGLGETVTIDQLVCPAGKYYIRVAENPVVSQSSPDLYNLKVVLDTSDIYECNNSFPTASSISLDEEIHAALRSADDVDFFCFTIPRAGIINARATNVPAEITMNMRIFHESNQSNWVAEGGGGFGETVVIDQLVCPAGKYYIRVAENPNTSQTSPDLYTLKVTLDTSDIYECNHTFNEAKLIPCNSPIFASIRSSNDIDYYKFNVPEAGTVTATISNVPANIDIEGQFRTDLDFQIGNSFSAGDGQSIIATFDAPQAGDYFIYLTDDESNNGQYKLTLTCPGVVQTAENELENLISIYPNPTNEVLHLDILGKLTPKQYKYKIRNVIGEQILHEEIRTSTVTIDVGKLPRGLYIIEVSEGKGKAIRQFIKI